ncbi:unnamed protein product [Lota lota]
MLRDSVSAMEFSQPRVYHNCSNRLSSSGVPFAGLQPVPGGRNWAAIQPPLQKDDSTLRLAYSALELSPWAMPASLLNAVGTLDAGPSRRGPAQLFVDAAGCTLAGQRYFAPAN